MAQKLLIAIELDSQSANDVLGKAMALRADDDQYDVVTVVDPASVAYSVDPTMTGAMFQQSYDTSIENARLRLVNLCEPHDIGPERCRVLYGRVSHEIQQLVRKEKYDGLMIGSHGFSGWRRLLGSQATSILHGMPVDTWVFKVG